MKIKGRKHFFTPFMIFTTLSHFKWKTMEEKRVGVWVMTET